MAIYVLNIILILFFSILYKKRIITRKMCCICIGVQLTLLSGMRSQNVGFDTYNYLNIYEIDGMMTFNNLFSYYQGFNGEIGFHLLNKILWMVGISSSFYLMIIAAIYSFSISRFIYKESISIEISYIALFTFNFFQFSMTGLRQAIAISIVLFALLHISEKKYINAIIAILIASQFHFSSLICLFFIPLKHFITSKKGVCYFTILTLCSYILKEPIANFLINFFKDKSYIVENNGQGMAMMFVYFLITIYLLIVLFQVKNSDVDNYLYYFKIFVIATFFQFLVPVQNIFFRISMFFGYSLIILLPLAIKTFKKRDITIIYMLTLIFLLLVYFTTTINSSGVVPYEFFWKG